MTYDLLSVSPSISSDPSGTLQLSTMLATSKVGVIIVLGFLENTPCFTFYDNAITGCYLLNSSSHH
jgi:hypothetical protein